MGEIIAQKINPKVEDCKKEEWDLVERITGASNFGGKIDILIPTSKCELMG